MRKHPEFEDFQKKYPNLFKEYPRSGFALPAGWSALAESLCANLENHITQLPEEIRGEIYVAQVKEKFGGLRWYMNQQTPYIQGAISLAESLSYKICEVCGLPGKTRNGGWIRVLCDHDAALDEAHRKEENRKYMEAQRAKKKDQ